MKKKTEIEQQVPVMMLNMTCKNFFLCSNFEIKTYMMDGHNHRILGRPSLHEDPYDCKFYKSMIESIRIFQS